MFRELFTLSVVGAGAWLLWPRRPFTAYDGAGFDAPVSPPAPLSDLWSAVTTSTGWSIPDSATPYLASLHDAEMANGIPHDLLVRLAYQESHFRSDIISGSTTSSAGAVGIMQIVPRWHPNVDPTDPFASITYAAAYLRAQYNRFGTWSYALAAYNWGPGNVAKWIAGNASPPVETQLYVAQITGDVNVA